MWEHIYLCTHWWYITAACYATGFANLTGWLRNFREKRYRDPLQNIINHSCKKGLIYVELLNIIFVLLLVFSIISRWQDVEIQTCNRSLQETNSYSWFTYIKLHWILSCSHSVQDSASEPASGSYLDLKLYYFKNIFFSFSKHLYVV